MASAGRPPGGKKAGGRKAGVPNKATAEVKALAQKHVPEVIAELVRLAKSADSEAARVSACKELLDRAVGKAAQAVNLSDSEGNPIKFNFVITTKGSDGD